MGVLLSSGMFGCLRYLPPEKGIIPFLQTACSLSGNRLKTVTSVRAVHYVFWPSLHAAIRVACEPDVVIGLETEEGMHIVVVEAKYHSDVSSREDEGLLPNNQLARELDQLAAIRDTTALGWPARMEVVSHALLFITKDTKIPADVMSAACSEFYRKRKTRPDIFWTSWRFLPSILESNLATESVPEHQAVMDDMLRLLQRKWLIMFGGFDAITSVFSPSDYEFYSPTKYSYGWPQPCFSSLAFDFYQLSSEQYTWPDAAGIYPLPFLYQQVHEGYTWPDAFPVACPEFFYEVKND